MMKRLYNVLQIASCVILILFVTLIVLTGVGFQERFERYTLIQKARYGILEGRERLSYKPALWYVLFDRRKLMPYGHMVYKDCEAKYFISGFLYDGYIVACYYTEEELVAYDQKIEARMPQKQIRKK